MLLLFLVDNEKKYTRFAGNFEDHADAPLRFGAHRLIEHDQWLLAEPLSVSIGKLFAPYCSGRPPWSSTAATP